MTPPPRTVAPRAGAARSSAAQPVAAIAARIMRTVAA